MMETHTIGEATKKAVTAPARLLGLAPAEALVDLVSLKNPLKGMQDHVRSALGDVFFWPLRVAKNLLVGGARAAWAGVRNAPVIPVSRG
ncbi:hypothetical protein FJZ28_03945 [Candidatus Peregrinibacteria bacterium]|nr:hypothetical protein [Candidatus Peregrinibacteria bacterium]